MHPTLFNEIFPSTPASFEFINSLKSFQITENELKEQSKNNNCAICLGKLELDEEASKLKCEHIFHITCIQFWLSKVILRIVKTIFIIKYLAGNLVKANRDLKKEFCNLYISNQI